MALSDQALPLVLTVGGAALCIAEAIAPGAHFIVVGVALLLAGLIGLLVPALAGPLALAVLVGVIGAATLYGYRRYDFYGGKGEARTRDSADLEGQDGVVTETVTPSAGQVRLRDGGFDPTYSARTVSGDIPEGSEIIVTDAGGGSVLTVESVDGMDEIDRELAAGRREEEDERKAESESESESA